jgi:hypothetical protein
MYVQSVAVTDDPITLDVTSAAFISFMNSVKDYRVYDFLNPNIQAEEVVNTEETTVTEGGAEVTEPAAPAEPTTLEEEPETPFSL